MFTKLNVAVIGSGGREHTIIKKLRESSRLAALYAIPGNAGMKNDCELVNIKVTDIKAVIDFCKLKSIDYVVVTPDDPLALGMVDALADAGIASFGPTKAAAQIEASKIFAKNLMKVNNIPTASYETFDDAENALSYIKKYFTDGHNSVVIKADGLALGKGVTICQNLQEAIDAVTMTMKDKKFGASGERIVIEEFIEGPEVSVLSFCDGKTLIPMISSMDHKRALDGDNGLNTGGMGTIAPNPFWNSKIESDCIKNIFMPTVNALSSSPFKGCLYFGLMLTKDGPFVIEYNCRFGDPETQVVLPLLEGDLLEIMLACTNGTLDKVKFRFSSGSAACVIMASGGYPGDYKKGVPINGIAEAEKIDGVTVYTAGTDEKDGSLVTAGGRVLGVTAVECDLKSAIKKAYSAVEKINFKDAHYRKDIGAKALSPDFK